MSVTLRHLFSPILRRWCTSTSASHRNDDVTNCDDDGEEFDDMETKMASRDDNRFNDADIENGKFKFCPT